MQAEHRESLARANAEARAVRTLEEARFHLTCSNMPLGIIVTHMYPSPLAGLTWANKYLADMIGYSLAELNQMWATTAPIRVFYPPSVRDFVFRELLEALRDGRTSWSGFTPLQHKSGRLINALCSRMVEYNDEGLPICWRTFVQKL